MVSRTSLTESVRAFRWAQVRDGLAERPDLLAVRDERGRNWLHLACAAPLAGARDSLDSIALADLLLDLGLGIDEPAFTEGAWQATPLWFCISRGRNLPLAARLLGRGCTPDFCLYAAVWNGDLAAIDLLIRHGARVDDDSAEGVTPFFEAIGWSRFEAAGALLAAGADPDFRDAKGRTALHLMLKKGSAAGHFEMLIAHGARGDIEDAEGRTAIDILRRKKDPVWCGIAERLVANGPRARNRAMARSFSLQAPRTNGDDHG